MKIKDITEWSGRWSTPSGTLEAIAAVEDGVLVDLSLWVMGTSSLGTKLFRTRKLDYTRENARDR
jgi:hypothetical protein